MPTLGCWFRRSDAAAVAPANVGTRSGDCGGLTRLCPQIRNFGKYFQREEWDSHFAATSGLRDPAMPAKGFRPSHPAFAAGRPASQESAMYQLSRTVPVNEPKKSFLSRHDVWNGLLMKANNALPYVPEMKKCDVVEQGDGWLVRDIMLKDVPLREKVTFEPENRVVFERTRGSELGRIENIIGEDPNGNLTLTFAFSLKKDAVPEGSDAEKAHFAPMEGAYLNAVASTLAAVRRTVDERGREHLPPKHPTDTAGDTRWIYEYYRAVDAMDMERTLAQHTDDTTLTFANHPTVHGKEGYKAAIGHLWGSIKGLSHSMTGAWSMHDGQVGVAEAIVQYTRMDDSLCAIKFCSVLRRRGDKIADLRIYGDATPLFAPAK
jgi:ketosteroid isomerase-like protein